MKSYAIPLLLFTATAWSLSINQTPAAPISRGCTIAQLAKTGDPYVPGPGTYAAFGRPVIGQVPFAGPGPSPVPLVAFPARAAHASLTAANDEGVWSNGTTFNGSAAVVLKRILQEGAAPITAPPLVAGATLGNGSLLAVGSTPAMPSVENLQISPYGQVVCQIYEKSNSGVVGKIGLAVTGNGGTAEDYLNLGETIPGGTLVAREAPQIDSAGDHILARIQQISPAAHRIDNRRFSYAYLFSPPYGSYAFGIRPFPPSGGGSAVTDYPLDGSGPNIFPSGGTWMASQMLGRPGSPSIGDFHQSYVFYGEDNTAFPSGPGIFLEHTSALFTVLRKGLACPVSPLMPAAVTRWGNPAATLMVCSGDLNNHATAWQMSSMLPATGTVPVPNTMSLWTRTTNGGGAAINCIAAENQSAPGTLNPATGTMAKFKCFHALHVHTGGFDWPSTLGYQEAVVTFGAGLDVPGKHAIYACSINVGVPGPLHLVATNLGASTPIAGAIPGTGPFPLERIDGGSGLFSTARHAEICFKATLGTGAPAGEKQVVVTAKPPLYNLETWAQSGVTLVNPKTEVG